MKPMSATEIWQWMGEARDWERNYYRNSSDENDEEMTENKAIAEHLAYCMRITARLVEIADDMEGYCGLNDCADCRETDLAQSILTEAKEPK